MHYKYICQKKKYIVAADVFSQVKKQNGELFAKQIRAYDNGIFDIPDIVDIVRYAGRDAEPLMNYLISLKNIQVAEIAPVKDPFELLKSAGYRATHADTLEKQNEIRKYFASGEELCTFREPNRFERYHIMNVVRENADALTRSSFSGKEAREDEYGTSVMSIQIAKNGGFISIKNRYNHAVANPDNTLGSNPDNIVLGLSAALRRYFNVNFSSQDLPLPDGYVSVAGRIAKYNYEIENVYYGNNFYIKDGQIIELNHNEEIMVDYLIFNLKTRQVQNTELIAVRDGIIGVLESANKCNIIYENGNKILVSNEYKITMTEGQIIGLELLGWPVLDWGFLHCNKKLSYLVAPNTKTMGGFCFIDNKALSSIKLDSLTEMGPSCFLALTKISSAIFPKLVTMGPACFYNVLDTGTLIAPNLQKTEHECFRNTKNIGHFDLSSLAFPGNACFERLGHRWLSDITKRARQKFAHQGGLSPSVCFALKESNHSEQGR